MAGVLSALDTPGIYTITVTGKGQFIGASDTATVNIQKIQPTVEVSVSPTTLSGSGAVTLTLAGTNLPADTNLITLLQVTAANGTSLSLAGLTWEGTESNKTAKVNVPNTNETYTFTLAFSGNDCYAPVSNTAVLVTAQHSGGGGGGGGSTAYTIKAEAEEVVPLPPAAKLRWSRERMPCLS